MSGMTSELVCGCGHPHVNPDGSGSCSKFTCPCNHWHPPEEEGDRSVSPRPESAQPEGVVKGVATGSPSSSGGLCNTDVAAGTTPPGSDDLDRAITDIGVTILALRACDAAGEAVPARLRAHIRVMESEWFNVPTPEGARRRETLRDDPAL